MTLPSQNDRSSELGRMTRAENKKGMDPAMIALGVLLAVGATVGVYALIKNNKGPSTTTTTGTDTASTTTSNPVAGTGSTTASGTSTSGTSASGTGTPAPGGLPAEKPVTINQGSKSLSDTGAASTTPAGGTSGAPIATNANPNTGPGGGTATPPTPAPTTSVLSLITSGDTALGKGDAVAARTFFAKALLDPSVSSEQAASLRDKLGRINDDLVFSSKVTPGDTMVEQYTVASGDRLSTIPRKLDLATDWRLIQRVNKIKDANALRVGQKLKIVRGPFHAVVHKNDYRLDLFAGSPDEPDQWTFIKSFKVGLGTDDGTPTGTFVIKASSKLVNPTWVNPKNPAEKYAADDPKNPIGEYWMGLDGIGDAAQFKGFGIHGTIDPSSIGQQKSMGCVRLGDEDVKLMYELLTERISVVQIKP
jgi:hypothetical protein